MPLMAIHIDLRHYDFYGNQPYSELYVRIEGQSIKWVDHQARVQVMLILTDQHEQIVAYDKFELFLTTTDTISDLLELKRFQLLPGEYTARVEAQDMNNTADKLEMLQKLSVDEPTNPSVSFSDMVPLSVIRKDSSAQALVKNGYYMEPLAYHYIDENRRQLDFYTEIYITGDKPDTDLYFQYSIRRGIISDTTAEFIFTKAKKLKKLEVEPLLISLPAYLLESGEYFIDGRIVDKSGNEYAKGAMDFLVSNPEADIKHLETYNETPENAFVRDIQPEDMDYILKAHVPITDQNQNSTLWKLIRSDKIKSQRQFIFQLWKTRAPQNPEAAFNLYMDVAKAVDKKFYNNAGYGFQTDRGYIFLKYGKPSNVLTIDNEIDAPPYEIWYYNYLPTTSQTNVRFLFYNPSLVHNDFHLLHSTCLGEKSNPAWEVELYKSVPLEREGNTVDGTTVGPNWNRNARRYFNEY